MPLSLRTTARALLIVVLLLLVALVVIAVVRLLGPRIGNTFSSMNNSL